jgi:hydroxymethylpyrimidine/phosphomethylpyrimidine kinase
LQADLKTIHALGGYALTVPTAITAQNSQGVSAVYPLPSEVVNAQLQSILSDYQPHAIKIGMLGNLAVLNVVIQFLNTIKQQNSPPPIIVLDPVLISSSGKPLLEPDALPTFINELLPLVTLITPNIPEVNALLKEGGENYLKHPFQGQKEDIPNVAKALFSLGINAVMIKGGHSIDPLATDYLVQPNDHSNVTINAYSTKRINTPHTHGTGCTYASAIATELAKGLSLTDAVKQAKAYLYATLLHAENAQPNYRTLPKGLLERGGRKGGLGHFYNHF